MNQTIVPITIPVTPYPKPIHYFKIEQSSFEGSCFWQPQAEDAESLIHVNDIELAAGEYLSLDTNLAELNRKLTDTTVFNFQVGKGKTRLLHECMLGYLWCSRSAGQLWG